MPHEDPHHKMPWPKIEAAYRDEFGEISPDVYELAAHIWPWAKSKIARTTCNFEAGQRLMVKAVAIVTRKCAEAPERITGIKGYLVRTFDRLLMEEFEKESKHAQYDLQEAQLRSISERTEGDIAQTILVHEILERADIWTRETFQLLILGHSLDEIARMYGMKSNYLRSRWHKQIARLTRQIQSETKAVERKISQKQKRDQK